MVKGGTAEGNLGLGSCGGRQCGNVKPLAERVPPPRCSRSLRAGRHTTIAPSAVPPCVASHRAVSASRCNFAQFRGSFAGVSRSFAGVSRSFAGVSRSFAKCFAEFRGVSREFRGVSREFRGVSQRFQIRNRETILAMLGDSKVGPMVATMLTNVP